MSSKATRLEKITNILMNKKIVSVKELSDIFNVSEMTVRRDISDLKKNNVVDVFFGGISLKETEKNETFNYQIENEINQMTEEKKRIAQKAVSLIDLHDVILIDTGSTTAMMLDYMTDDMSQIIYCYALNIIIGACNKPNLSVVTCGGYFHRNTRMFESAEGTELIKKTQLNKVFMAARGVSEEIGITTAEPYEIHIKKTALSVSNTKILLADSTKFGKAWYAKYADLDDFDIIISDSGLEQEYRKMIKDRGITLYTV